MDTPALPESMRTEAPDGGGREPGQAAAQRPASPALGCLRGGESELHAPSAPPPPDFSPKPAFSGSQSPQEVLDPSLHCPRGAETHIPPRRPKPTSNSGYTVPLGRPGISVLSPVPTLPQSARRSSDSRFPFQTPSRRRDSTLPGAPSSPRRTPDSAPLGPGSLRRRGTPNAARPLGETRAVPPSRSAPQELSLGPLRPSEPPAPPRQSRSPPMLEASPQPPAPTGRAELRPPLGRVPASAPRGARPLRLRDGRRSPRPPRPARSGASRPRGQESGSLSPALGVRPGPPRSAPEASREPRLVGTPAAAGRPGRGGATDARPRPPPGRGGGRRCLGLRRVLRLSAVPSLQARTPPRSDAGRHRPPLPGGFAVRQRWRPRPPGVPKARARRRGGGVTH
ncbi:basic salivary proline-rich protein 1-like [Meriones unguiculatus]|uniref:basic salivary proline-rich protein 1-like n=1 Tax=Meriones unguiculatus TaxID=10047 RepID=UPI000B4F76C8|nr:basic salivary proline-rich protein 1-like [Meriones unguiculatus]XP_060222491.1 basic salivary proline-rich protein 1-like [Meriones unguiculatus]